MKHAIKHVRGGTWTILHPTFGPIYRGVGNRNEALRIAAALDNAAIDYAEPGAPQRIIAVVTAAYAAGDEEL